MLLNRCPILLLPHLLLMRLHPQWNTRVAQREVHPIDYGHNFHALHWVHEALRVEKNSICTSHCIDSYFFWFNHLEKLWEKIRCQVNCVVIRWIPCHIGVVLSEGHCWMGFLFMFTLVIFLANFRYYALRFFVLRVSQMGVAILGAVIMQWSGHALNHIYNWRHIVPEKVVSLRDAPISSPSGPCPSTNASYLLMFHILGKCIHWCIRSYSVYLFSKAMFQVSDNIVEMVFTLVVYPSNIMIARSSNSSAAMRSNTWLTSGPLTCDGCELVARTLWDFSFSSHIQTGSSSSGETGGYVSAFFFNNNILGYFTATSHALTPPFQLFCSNG